MARTKQTARRAPDPVANWHLQRDVMKDVATERRKMNSTKSQDDLHLHREQYRKAQGGTARVEVVQHGDAARVQIVHQP